MRAIHVALLGLLLAGAGAQALPDPDRPDQRPHLRHYACPARGGGAQTQALTEEERERLESRARYREYFPAYLARVGDTPAQALLTPVQGSRPTRAGSPKQSALPFGRALVTR